jgi:hypothetical protein
MGDGIPGFVPKLLSDPTVGLFRADERIFDAMVDGWRAQMLARGLTTATIENRFRLVHREPLPLGAPLPGVHRRISLAVASR